MSALASILQRLAGTPVPALDPLLPREIGSLLEAIERSEEAIRQSETQTERYPYLGQTVAARVQAQRAFISLCERQIYALETARHPLHEGPKAPGRATTTEGADEAPSVFDLRDDEASKRDAFDLADMFCSRYRGVSLTIVETQVKGALAIIRQSCRVDRAALFGPEDLSFPTSGPQQTACE